MVLLSHEARGIALMALAGVLACSAPQDGAPALDASGGVCDPCDPRPPPQAGDAGASLDATSDAHLGELDSSAADSAPNTSPDASACAPVASAKPPPTGTSMYIE